MHLYLLSQGLGLQLTANLSVPSCPLVLQAFLISLQRFSAHSFAVIPHVVIHNVTATCHALARAPATSSSQIPLPRYHSPTFFAEVLLLSFGFLFPKVCQDQQIPQASSLANSLYPTPAPAPPHPYMCICRGRKHLHCGNSKTPHYKRDAHLWQ